MKKIQVYEHFVGSATTNKMDAHRMDSSHAHFKGGGLILIFFSSSLRDFIVFVLNIEFFQIKFKKTN